MALRIGISNSLFREPSIYRLGGEKPITRVLREKWHTGADSRGFDQCAGLV